MQMREKLILLLQDIDVTLLQRITDYTRGLLDANPETQQDWWADLPDSVKEDVEEGLQEIEDGKLIAMEEVLKKYKTK